MAREVTRVQVVDCVTSVNLTMSLGVPIAQVVALAEDRYHLQERLGATLDDRPKMSKGEINLALKNTSFWPQTESV